MAWDPKASAEANGGNALRSVRLGVALNQAVHLSPAELGEFLHLRDREVRRVGRCCGRFDGGHAGRFL